MKLSRIPFKTSKSRGSEELNSVELLFQSGQLKRYAAGIYGYSFLLTRALQNVEKIVRDTLNKYGCIEVTLPELQPKSVWLESGRWEKYKNKDKTFYIEGRETEYFMAPTGEECMVHIAKSHINSYKDLNFNLYQIGRKFRDELRPRGGLLRGREFHMKDGYSFHDSKEAMEEEYENVKKCWLEIFTSLGLKTMPVRAVNTYGGKWSEEFMLFSEMGEDKVLHDEETGLVLNQEILEEKELVEDVYKKYGKIDFSKLKIKQAIEVGHIFMLDQFYSKSMNITFTNKEGKLDYCYMGTYGLGITRTLNAVLEQESDKDGLVYPLSIAPYSIGIVNLNAEKQTNEAKNLYEFFETKKVDVLWDDRDISLGMKIKDMLLNGIPYIVVIGKNDNGNLLEVECRKTRNKSLITKEELLKIVLN